MNIFSPLFKKNNEENLLIFSFLFFLNIFLLNKINLFNIFFALLNNFWEWNIPLTFDLGYENYNKNNKERKNYIWVGKSFITFL